MKPTERLPRYFVAVIGRRYAVTDRTTGYVATFDDLDAAEDRCRQLNADADLEKKRAAGARRLIDDVFDRR